MQASWRMMTLVAWCLASLGARPAAQAQALTPADEVARKVQARYDSVTDFEGQFTQTYEGGVLRTKTTERGTVVIKRPGRMRWVYTSPERKEFVSNGVKVYAYFCLLYTSPSPRD